MNNKEPNLPQHSNSPDSDVFVLVSKDSSLKDVSFVELALAVVAIRKGQKIRVVPAKVVDLPASVHVEKKE